jgi:hypothetical protein
MNLPPHIEEQPKDFCDRLAPFEEAYAGRAILGFCALRRVDKWKLYSAKLRLDPVGPRVAGNFHTAAPPGQLYLNTHH